ncbi:MAG: transcription antitermination factor NusB [Nitrospinaceae bacterium]|jgi:transcription antitermination protein NusB|nr:transcription antitermination factor NusB [Nitrospinaceae bacterium]MBT3433180.1 transcription antitermination factor NusB [Nitrospinaceae bacterium]MBT3821688.1 transcription antitermination factor NusB [Nitrospinaceae bacterium]MBT4093117.1 transcription antitermination factor NusB [Nitrospinaceae bacterium]MBT4432545.1 transcription antitermination factor NusB [Nitrospinaceae bacterium]
MSGRREARELAFQLLYHLDLTKGDAESETSHFWRINEDKSALRPFAEQLVGRVLANLMDIDRVISEASKRWTIKRMDSVSRCLLRLGACEILHFSDTPPEVAINEAVELAKRFGSEDTPSFINGILDRLHQKETHV